MFWIVLLSVLVGINKRQKFVNAAIARVDHQQGASFETKQGWKFSLKQCTQAVVLLFAHELAKSVQYFVGSVLSSACFIVDHDSLKN